MTTEEDLLDIHELARVLEDDGPDPRPEAGDATP